jgi:hypothetical protein
MIIYCVIFLETIPRHGESWAGTQSTLTQRVFIVLWLVLGSLDGIVAGLSLLQDGVSDPMSVEGLNASITIVEW